MASSANEIFFQSFHWQFVGKIRVQAVLRDIKFILLHLLYYSPGSKKCFVSFLWKLKTTYWRKKIVPVESIPNTDFREEQLCCLKRLMTCYKWTFCSEFFFKLNLLTVFYNSFKENGHFVNWYIQQCSTLFGQLVYQFLSDWNEPKVMQIANEMIYSINLTCSWTWMLAIIIPISWHQMTKEMR